MSTNPFFPVIVMFLAALPVAPVYSAVIYQTGFEPPDFVAGSPLVGQSGWGGFGDVTGDSAATVIVGNASAGSQAVQVKGADWGPVGPFAIYAPLPQNFDPVAAGTPIVTLSADVRLDGPQTFPPIDGDLISANIATRIGPGGVGGLFGLILSSDGNAYAFGSRGFSEAYLFQTPADLGVYHHLAMQLDFLAGLTEFFLDDVLMGALTFRTDVPTNFFRRPTLAFQGADPPADFGYDPADYTAYFDALVVSAEVPEPGTQVLIVVGLLAFMMRRPASLMAGYRRNVLSRYSSNLGRTELAL